MLGFSKQAFFRWRADPVSQRDWDNAHLTNAAIDLHRDDPGFGYRFISDEIEGEAGLKASERRIWRLCSEQRLWSLRSKKRGVNRKAGPPVHDDLVLRDFTATELNQLWLTDITEHWTDEGKLYLCAIKDVCSNRIVGYSIDSRMTADLAVAALRNAAALREPIGTTLHSDRGSQFRSRKFVEQLKEFGITGSMGRVGACADNAAMESLLLAAAEEHSEQAAVALTAGPAAGDRDLDRANLPPPQAATKTWPAHPDRVRDNQHTSRSRGLKPQTKRVN